MKCKGREVFERQPRNRGESFDIQGLLLASLRPGRVMVWKMSGPEDGEIEGGRGLAMVGVAGRKGKG